ncbi:MAG: hypothetical protein P4L33_22105 [Capsulimonadaceae bacterium]|nr:hypothetical protein [Capsulimonadaceae bacterium]
MKVKTLLPAIVCALFMSLSSANAAPAFARSLFVWDSSGIRGDQAAQSAFFRFIDAPFGHREHAIETLFFDGVRQSGFDDGATEESLRRFLRAAHGRGLSVYYLCGDPAWATPAQQPRALASLNAVIAFNARGKRGEQYDGITYDVEPYLVKGWPSQDLRDGYLELLQRSGTIIRASRQRFTMTAVIPRWFSNPELNGLDQRVIDASDGIVIMDYVTTASRLVNDAGKELSHASSVNKPAWIAVETGELKETPRATFFGQPASAMEQVLSEALRSFQSQTSFAGYAIHCLGSYQAMQP